MQRPFHGGVLRSLSSSLINKTRSLFGHPKRNRHARRRYRKLYGDHQVQPLEPRVLLSATIEGSAWYDDVYDNLRGLGDTEASAIVVNLLDSDGTQLDSTATVNGDYSFTALADGDYIIEFELPTNYSFVLEGVGVDESVDSDVDVLTGRSQVITLSDSDIVDIDAGFVLTSELPETYSGTVDLSNLLNGTWDGAVFNGITAGDKSGSAVSSAGDVNGDGYEDFLIGASDAAPNGDYSGQTYLVYGQAADFTGEIELSDIAGGSLAGAVFNGPAVNAYTGITIDSAGDVNGDGYDDLLIGANGVDGYTGATYLIYGQSSGLTGEIDLSDVGSSIAGAVFNGIDDDDLSGFSVSSAGDVNGDGYADLLIGAYEAQPNGFGSGETYLVYGQSSGLSGEIDLSDIAGGSLAGAVFNGIDESYRSGYEVSSAGDVNGDGFDDLLILAPEISDPNPSESETYLVYGHASDLDGVIELSEIAAGTLAGAVFIGLDNDTFNGTSMSSAGDVNGDGYVDLLIGFNQADAQSGETYLVYGQASGLTGVLDLSDIAGGTLAGAVFKAIDSSDFSGYSVSAAGDVNGDGFDDILIGAPYADPHGDLSGESYLIYGQASGLSGELALSDIASGLLAGVVFNGINGNDRSGTAVSSAGDVNADGFADLLIGAYQADPNGGSSGETYLVYGGMFKPTDVYVDDDWSAVSTGDDPDGSGAATNFGYDAFASIQEALDAVAGDGTIYIAGGTYAEDLVIGSGVTIKGTFDLDGTLTLTDGASLAPGNSPGIMNTGSITMGSGTTLDIEIDGNTVGTEYDQLNVTGTVDITDSTLNVILGYTPTDGDSYIIINNDGVDAITGTFDGLAQGDQIVVSGLLFAISYVGGDGNDVELTYVHVNPDDVYVDDDWAGLSLGVDPDGVGPATAIGVDAFAIIQDGIDAVNTDGTVHVYAGTYDGGIDIDKGLTLQGETGDAADVVIDASSSSYGINSIVVAADLQFANFSVLDSPGIGISVDQTGGNVTFDNVVIRRSSNNGIQVNGSAMVELTDTISSDNLGYGLLVLDVDQFTDTNGRFNFNNDGGIFANDIAGDVELTRTILNNNDNDDDGTGNGLTVTASGSYAIDGNLTLNGVRFGDTDASNNAYHQEYGLYIEDGISGNVLIQSHDDGNDVVDSVAVGHDQTGIHLRYVEGDIDIIGGYYLYNEGSGVFVRNGNGFVTLDGVEAKGNAEGAYIRNTDGLIINSHFQDNGYGIRLRANSEISILDNQIIENEIGIRVLNSRALIQGNDLSDNTLVGLEIDGDATVDAGDIEDDNVTGLGTGSMPFGSSAGQNTFFGYDGLSNLAINNLNEDADDDIDVLAEMNTFDYVAFDFIESVVNHDQDDSDLTEVYFGFTIPAVVVTDVYVDDDWDAVAWGDDPDGIGPATAMGVDAFYTIQDGVDAVADGGTIHVYDGTYLESVYIIEKDMTITGVSMDPTGVIVDAEDVEEVFNIFGVDNLTIEYLTAQNGDDDIIDITDSGMITLDHLLVQYADEDGIDAHYTDQVIVSNTTIQYMGDDGISFYEVGTATLQELTIEYGYGSGIAFEEGGLLDIDGLWINEFGDYGIQTEYVEDIDIYDATVQYTDDSSMELWYGYSVILDMVNVSNTGGWGLDIYDWYSTDLTDVSASHAANDGMWIDFVDVVNLTRVTAQYNDYDGIYITDALDITLLDVNASYNVGSGLNVEIAESLSDTNGVYTENEDSGISILYVMGESIFTRTTATNNNADFGDYGVGLEIYGFPFGALIDDIGDIAESFEGFLFGLPSDFLDLLPDDFLDYDFGSFPFSAGGSVTIRGGTFSDMDGNLFAGDTYSQTAGIVIEGIAGDVTIEAHDDGNDIQTTSITGNDELGVILLDVAGNITIEDADISDNYGEGLYIDKVYDIAVTNTSVDYNNGFGLRITSANDVTFTDVTAQFNHFGMLLGVIDSFSDTDGLYADNDYAGISLFDIANTLTLTGTIVRDNGAIGIWFSDQESATFNQLTVTGNDIGILMEDYVREFELTNSFITGNRIGLQIDELIYNFGYTVFDNDLSDNTDFAIVNNDTDLLGVTAPINAAGNWFGSTDPLAVLAEIDGLADYSYFLASDADTSADTGFQGDFVTLYVTYLASQIQTISRIQEAIDNVDDDGTVIVQSGPYDGDVTVDAHKTLQGAISFNGTLTLTDNAVFEPGNSPGVISIADDFIGQAGTTLVVEINGDTIYTDYDILFVDGNVTLGGMTLDVILGYVPDAGDTITLIDNVGPSAVNGTFDGLTEGTTFTIDGYDATITYIGGDGNDVELTFIEQNVAPTAGEVNDVAVEDGGPVVIAYNADDANADDDVTTLTYNFITTPSEGSVSDNGDGTFTFDPGSDFQDLGVGQTRKVSFTYQATDSHGADSTIQTINITVSGTNDGVSAGPNLVSTDYDTPIDIDVLYDDVDIDGDPLHIMGFGDTPWDSTVVAITNLGATVSINPDGTVHYDPTGVFDSLTPGDTVRDYIRYFAEDPYGLYDRHIIFIDVTRPLVTVSTASFSFSNLSSTPPVSLSYLGGHGGSTTSGMSSINQAALAFASQQATLHIAPLPATGSHWLDSLNGDDDKDTAINLLDVETE